MISQQLVDGQEVPFLMVDAFNRPVREIPLDSIEVTQWKPGFEGFGKTENKKAHREIGKGWYTYLTGLSDTDTLGLNIFSAEATFNKDKVSGSVVCDIVPAYPTTS
jgi:hypothetical protein